MHRLLLRIMTAVQLTRLTMAFGAVSDVWFVILLTQADDRYAGVAVFELPTAAALAIGAVVAVGLFAYGAALNDVLDVRHDTTFSPRRPIPAGRIRMGQAIVVTVAALIVAVLAGAMFGVESLRLTLLTAAGILFYNAAGKYIPGVGLVTIGLVHAAHMFIPNFELAFTLPVWLVMSHMMAVTLAVYVYEDKRPRLSRRALAATAVGWAFWSALVIGLGVVRADEVWPADASLTRLLYPALTLLAFLIVARWKTIGVSGRSAAEKLKRYGAMWQSLYGASWLFALGLTTEGWWLLMFAIAGFASMTLIKELMGLSGQPITYRA